MNEIYKVVQIWPGLIVSKQVTVCPGHIWTTLYNAVETYNGPIHVSLIKRAHCAPHLTYTSIMQVVTFVHED